MKTAEDTKIYRAAEQRLWEFYNMTPREQFLDLADPAVRVRVQEVGDGPPILFVHGGPNAGSTWVPLVSGLTGFRCLLLDRPGCGLSEPVDYNQIDLPTFGAALLNAVLDALGLDQVALVCSSFGGALGFYFAEAHPDRVSRIIQEGCPAFVPGFKTPPFMRLLSIGPIGRMAAKQKSTRQVGDMIMRQIGHGKSLDTGRMPDIIGDWYLDLMNHTNTMSGDLGAIQKSCSVLGFKKEYFYDEKFLSRIPHPTLFMWGEDDAFGGIDVGQNAAAAIPNAVLYSQPDAGHLPWLDDPELHARMITDFLTQDGGGMVASAGFQERPAIRSQVEL